MRNRLPTILIVDDEIETFNYLRGNLETRGYDVLGASDGSEALKVFKESPIDLVLIDINLPGANGFEICKHLRQVSDSPIIVLSGRGSERDKVTAFDMGADGYLTKPFSFEELLAMVRAALRRFPTALGDGIQKYRFGAFELDTSSRRVIMRDKQIQLTPTEFSLLTLLVRNAGKVLSRRHILSSVWGPEYITDEQYLWTYVRRLRKKLGDDAKSPRMIFTEPGIGYRFDSEL